MSLRLCSILLEVLNVYNEALFIHLWTDGNRAAIFLNQSDYDNNRDEDVNTAEKYLKWPK